MNWKSCKDDPPKSEGYYLLCFTFKGEKYWGMAYYNIKKKRWEDEDFIPYNDEEWVLVDSIPYKWAEVKLPE